MKKLKAIILSYVLLGAVAGAHADAENNQKLKSEATVKAPLKKSDWSFSASTGWSRPLVTPVTQMMDVSLSSTYSKFKNYNLGFGFGAYRSLVKESLDPDRDQGLTDVRLSLSLKEHFFKNDWLKSKGVTTGVSFGVSLPTSESSKAQTKQGSVSFSTSFSKEIFNGIRLGTGLRGFYAKHRYTNYVVAGSGSPFSYLGFSVPISVSRAFFKNKTSVSLSYGISTSLNYDSDWVEANNLVVSVGQTLTKKFSVSGSYSWGDKIETDNDIFIAEALQAGVSLSYRF